MSVSSTSPVPGDVSGQQPEDGAGDGFISSTSRFLSTLAEAEAAVEALDANTGGGVTCDNYRSQGTAVPGVVSALRSAIESVLLVIDSPAPADLIARAVDCTEAVATEILTQIREEYILRQSGFDLRETAEGWRLYTTPRNAPAVERLLLDGTQSRLTRAALETLAVVAYRQPCTRSQVAAIRGVNVDGVMRTLLLRGLVREVGTENSTGAHLYTTTELFLELMGIEDLSALPDLAPLLPDIDSIDETY